MIKSGGFTVTVSTNQASKKKEARIQQIKDREKNKNPEARTALREPSPMGMQFFSITVADVYQSKDDERLLHFCRIVDRIGYSRDPERAKTNASTKFLDLIRGGKDTQHPRDRGNLNHLGAIAVCMGLGSKGGKLGKAISMIEMVASSDKSDVDKLRQNAAGKIFKRAWGSANTDHLGIFGNELEEVGLFITQSVTHKISEEYGSYKEGKGKGKGKLSGAGEERRARALCRELTTIVSATREKSSIIHFDPDRERAK